MTIGRTHLVLVVPGWKLSPLHAQARELLMMQCLHRGVDLSIMPEFSSGIDLARNITVAKFLEIEDATVLGMIDSDIAFNPENVFEILEAIEQGLDVVGVIYPKKVVDYKAVARASAAGVPDEDLKYHAGQFVGGAAPGSRRSWQSKSGKRFVDADKLGTGFLFMARSAIEKFIAFHKKRIEHRSFWEPKGLQHTVFFSEMQGARQKARDYLLDLAQREAKGMASPDEVLDAARAFAAAQEGPMDTYQTEDFNFIYRAKEAGIQCWMYLDAQTAHQGTWVFEGNLASVLEQPNKKEAAE